MKQISLATTGFELLNKGERDPEVHQTKKGNQWHFGMKVNIGMDADSGLVQTFPKG